MRIKFLQLNTWQGHFLDRIGQFVKKNNYDLVNFQEVLGGSIEPSNSDNYSDFKKKFGLYNSEIAIKYAKPQNPESYFGTATFFKKKYKLLGKKIIWLKRNPGFDYDSGQWEKFPVNALSLLLESENRKFNVINTHLVWGPTPVEEKYKRDQNKRLVKYIKSLNHPFILTGDFNITSDAFTVKALGKLARNLTVENKTSNTLDPKTHSAKHLFPKGLAVDYIFVSKHFKVKKFGIIRKPTLSDHYALEAELEL